MATYNKIQDFVEQLGLVRPNLNTHTLRVALNRSDAAAGAGAAVQATDTVLADIVQPTGTGYTAGGIDTLNTWAEAAGPAPRPPPPGGGGGAGGGGLAGGGPGLPPPPRRATSRSSRTIPMLART